jgi:hypothetical protein
MVGIIESVLVEIREFISNNKVAVGGVMAAVAAFGPGGLLALIPALIVIAAILAAFLALLAVTVDSRLGSTLNDLKDQLLNRPDPAERAAGLFVWQCIALKLFEREQGRHAYSAISYAVMDGHNYLDKSCNVNVDSIEVFFDATDPMLVAFVDALIAFEIRQEFRGRAIVGYVSLRFTARTRALLGMQRFPVSCAVEVAGLKDVTGTTELIDFAIALSRDRNFRGILHWGQRNPSTAADIEFRFGDDLRVWREALARITDNGRLDGFSSGFTRRVGLEVV